MAFVIQTRTKTRLRVRQGRLPKKQGVLGDILLAADLPEGHACCPKCSGYKFEASGFPGSSKVELGCVNCGERFYVMFPLSVEVPQGRYGCRRHPNKAQVLIHNVGTICIGCEACRSQIVIKVREDGLVMGDA